MIFTVRVPQGYKTPGSLEEAARVMGGQLVSLKLLEAPRDRVRDHDWEATIVVPNDVVVDLDPDAGEWVPGWAQLEEERAALREEEEARQENG